MRIKKWMLVICALQLCNGVVCADEGKWNLGVQPGYEILKGDFRNSFKDAPGLLGFITYKIDETLTTGLEIGYSFGHKSKETAEMSADTNGDFILEDYNLTYDRKLKILQITPVLKITKGPENLKPYLVFGGGMYSIGAEDATVGVSAPGGSVSSTITKFGGTFFGINGGIGVNSKINEKFGWGIDLRYHAVFVPEFIEIVVQSGQDLHYFVPSFNVTYNF